MRERLGALLRRSPFGRILPRLLIVNLGLVLVPLAGLEFAELFERELLTRLEADMRHQAIAGRRWLEHEAAAGRALDDPALVSAIERRGRSDEGTLRILAPDDAGAPEATRARRGERASHTRLVRTEWGIEVWLAVAEPVFVDGRVAAIVRVETTTAPVLRALYRIREGLYLLAGVAAAIAAFGTAMLALGLARPVHRLRDAAASVEAGDLDTPIPLSGPREIYELGEALRGMTAELRERVRFAESLAADVAHELKSPLTSLRAAAELVHDDPEMPDADRARFLRGLVIDADQLRARIDRLLDLARLEAGRERPSPVDPRDIIDVAVGGADVTVTLDPAVPERIHWRALDVEAAIANLIDNAFAHGAAPVSLEATRDGAFVVIVVRDQGPGVDEAARARIFDRFYTTRRDAGGTGLGLAIVRAAAEAHRGDVRLLPSSAGCAIALRLRDLAP